MLEVGVVERVNEKRGTAKVVFDRKSACDKCRMCLTASGEKMKVYVEVKNSLGAKTGDKVGIAMNDRFVLKAAFIVYIIPVILVGIGLAIFRGLSDLLLLAVVAGGLLLGAGIGIVIDRLIRKKGTFSPTMIEIYSDPPAPEDAPASEPPAQEETSPAVSEDDSDRNDPSKIE